MNVFFQRSALGLLGLWVQGLVLAEPVRSEAKATTAGSGGVSLTLQECLVIATRLNPDLLRASTGFTDAEGKAIQLRSVLYPQIGAVVVSTPPTIYAQIEQVLYDRAIDPRLKLSRLAFKEADTNYRQVLTKVVYQTRQAFIVALARQESVLLQERYQDFYKGILPRAGQLFEAGRIQKVEISRMEVKANLVRQKLLDARSSQHQALLGLEILLGQKLPDDLRLKGELGKEVLPALDMDNLIVEAFLNRADYQALKTARLSQNQQIVLSTEAIYPRLAFGSKSTIQPGALSFAQDYDVNRNDNEPNIQRAAGNTQVPLSFYMNWTFFDGGASAGSKQSAEASLASQTEALEAMERFIPNEIREAVETLDFTQKTLNALILSPDPQKQRETYDLDYQAGKIRLLDQSLMEDSIFMQEQKILEVRLHFSLSAAALDRSLGRVVQFKQPE